MCFFPQTPGYRREGTTELEARAGGGLILWLARANGKALQGPVTPRPVRRGGEDTGVHFFPPADLYRLASAACGRDLGGGGNAGTVVLGSDERRPELANLTQFVPSRT